MAMDKRTGNGIIQVNYSTHTGTESSLQPGSYLSHCHLPETPRTPSLPHPRALLEERHKAQTARFARSKNIPSLYTLGTEPLRKKFPKRLRRRV